MEFEVWPHLLELMGW